MSCFYVWYACASLLGSSRVDGEKPRRMFYSITCFQFRSWLRRKRVLQ
ncbi:unnamed protein product [Brassica oleracea]